MTMFIDGLAGLPPPPQKKYDYLEEFFNERYSSWSNLL